jgi:hypothetical protein
MRQVRCVSPHGGAHNGLMHNGDPAPPGFAGPLQLEPNEGGYVVNGVLGTVAVGSVVDAPDDFTCDGFHFVDVDAPPPPVTPAGNPLSDLLKKGDG